MQQSNEQRDSLIVFALHSIHFYASMIGGWWIFHNAIYPLAYFGKGAATNLAAQLPVYVGNTMAFGCMVYVMTRPLALLSVRVVEEAERVIERFLNK